ncbi:unnamed protein product, partial [Mesorhabditis belari]|uniref:Uncharacterized protein n=1 Tax=Mesorhabditis belari TaxID=2138241 RepID=A0AAF3EFN3_9BILA
MTKLEHGFLSIKKSNLSDFTCRARCYDYKHSTRSIPRNWTEIEETLPMKFDCDFVHAECIDDQEMILDSYLHTQIVENDKSTVTLSTNLPNAKMPDVYLIIIDSLSSTQARRTLPRTLSFLESEMGGMHMHHLNKVGENSRPNGFAILMNWRIQYIRRQAYGGTDLHTLYNRTMYCDTYHDDDFVIFREFEKIGYKTMYNDDYSSGNVFTWPNCKGFTKHEANHGFRPFIYAWGHHKPLQEHVNAKNCLEKFALQLQYISKFVNSYNGTNKFVLDWMSALSHDDPNDLFHADEAYESFFRTNQKKFENAFIFFMGDHGPRFGAVPRTKLGRRELKNPLLHITVPKWLQSNEQLMSNLRENSLKLLTQYDVFATLLDILKYSPQSNYTDFSFIPMDESKMNNGTSILRPLGPFSHRNCRNIPTDATYCLCEYRKERISDSKLQKVMGNLLVNAINNELIEKNLTALCRQLELDKVIAANSYVPIEKTFLYEIVIKTKPGGGEFSSVLKSSNSIDFVLKGDILRINSYGKAGDCVASSFSEMRPLCLCFDYKPPPKKGKN